jgi:hypothetical protein
MQQHGEIDRALNKVCKMLAKCNVNDTHQEALLKIFLKKMNDAVGNQQDEGQKATWYSVQHDEKKDA